MNNLNGKLVGTFIGLNVADAVLTQKLLQTGLYHEGNVWVPTTPEKMLLYKLVIPAAFVVGISALARPPYATANNILILANGFMGLIVGWNAYNLIKAGQGG